MGASWGHLAKVSNGMECAVRSEATRILLSGRYLKGGGCCGTFGAEALTRVLATVHAHKDAESAYQLFGNVARDLPLRYPSVQDLNLCDLRGCLTLGDVACIFMQRVVVQCLRAEAKMRLWPKARSEHRAVHPCCWVISFITCTFPCLSCYEQQISCVHGGGCPCGPCCVTPSRTDVAWAEFEVALGGIPPLAVVAVASAWRRAIALHKPQHFDEVLPGRLLDGSGASAVHDKDWNWADMQICMGRPLVGFSPRSVLAFMVVADDGIECTIGSGGLATRRLECGSIVYPESFSARGVVLPGGLECPLMSEDKWLLLPLTRQWQTTRRLPALDDRPEWIFDENTNRLDGEGRCFDCEDIVTAAADAKQCLKFDVVPQSHGDLIRVWRLDGSMVFSAGGPDRESISNLTITSLKSQLLRASGSKGKHWMLDFIIRSSGLLAHDAEKLSDIIDNGDVHAPLDLELVIKNNDPVYGSWLQEKDGFWVPIFNQEGEHVLIPLVGEGASPDTVGNSILDNPDRFFFSPDEFPQLCGLSSKWQLLRDEALRLWQDRLDLFVEYESHAGWMVCCLKLWGSDVSGNFEAAPVAAKLVQESGIEKLTTFCYSVLKPGCHIKPHEEHPGTSCIRAHLGLVIPDSCAVRVGPYAQIWSEGEWKIFNGRRSHEVLNTGTRDRIVLLVDFGGPKVDSLCWPAWIQHAFHKTNSQRCNPLTAGTIGRPCEEPAEPSNPFHVAEEPNSARRLLVVE